VPDSFTRAQRYRERAAECRRLAAMTLSPKPRADYEELARRYDEIAEMEVKLAGTDKPVSIE
jgi:hypothetical protein